MLFKKSDLLVWTAAAVSKPNKELINLNAEFENRYNFALTSKRRTLTWQLTWSFSGDLIPT